MLAGTGLLRAGEHPHEHPSGSGHEHPSKTGKTSSASSVTMEDLAKAITDYVQKDSALKGGHFLLYDPVAKKALPLTLDKVHKDRLSKVSDDTYFACADFKTPEGKAYDLDVFMKGADAASLQATEVSIHKEDGKARYGWVEEKGIWKKK
ncbi:MAG: hypothetical protein HY548_00085 [Elusimicrobia bacterium]|nr:hypothetical protein [Elusimicrobiota bacterium]